MKQRRTRGFSVVELLISVAIFAVLLAVGAAMMRSASDAFQTTNDTTLTQERLDAVTQIVRYDVRLAGYLGSGETLLNGGAPFTWSATSPTELTLRYNEDRYSEAGSSLAVTYALADATLTRQVTTQDGAGAVNDMIPGVSSMTVTEDLGAGGVTEGLRIDLTLSSGDVIPIAARFANVQE